MSFPVFFDTCVLYGGSLNDLMLRLADEEAFAPLWSADVLDELHRNLADRIGDDGARRRVSAMRDAFPEAEVTGYEELVSAMTCDPKDRHVLAAAVRGGAGALITFNLGDFPPESIAPYALSVVHPDDFLLNEIDLHPAQVRRAIVGQIRDSRRPRLTISALLGTLGRSGVPRFADEALRHDFG